MNMHWRPGRSRSRRRSVVLPTGLILVALSLVSALLLGGASRNNEIQVSLVEFASLPALMWALWSLAEDQDWRRYRWAMAVMASIAAIPLIQLIPLPSALWANWPGHQASADALRLAGVPIGWRPISLTPALTAGHLLALLPPFAIFLGVLRLRDRERTWLAAIVIVGALISLAIGALQVSRGVSSPLYFYDPTNLGSAVGLFSNRNHQASLLVVCLPFAALWVGLGRESHRYKAPIVAAALSIFLITVVGLVIVKSRAGVFLLPPAMIASFLILWRGDTVANRKFTAIIGGSAVLVLLVALVFGMGPLMERFADGATDLRGATSATVIEAAWNYLPLGSGIGSFVPVYASVEPVHSMSSAFWNHAHNDYFEMWLEAGVLALLVFGAFLAWWAATAWKIWRAEPSVANNLARAGSVATALLMIHATVDYPLRTLALAGVFAFSCALMAAGSRSEDA